MSTSLLFEVLTLRNKTSCPYEFEFYEIRLYFVGTVKIENAFQVILTIGIESVKQQHQQVLKPNNESFDQNIIVNTCIRFL